jgi:serine/threonine protein kinase
MQRLGPYRIERLLGRGGMGTVYVGVHVETGERAAIKALALTLADDQNFRQRFMAEIETLKQLKHPNIVQMLGDGEHDGHLFFVMELVEGRSLQEVLQSGHIFDWCEVIRIAIDICGALKHAHDCGVIHRDLKPANLLQTTDGRIKLTDFGIAKLFGATHRTADGSVVGTADYMAPEQADGRPVTNRSDLYSLGAVMFTLLARRTPFSGGSLPQVIHKLKYEEAPSVRRYAPETPEDLDHIIAELLRKEPHDRIPTALVLANRLRAMEHALLSREKSGIPSDQAATRVIEPEPQIDSATWPPPENAHPATKLSPTYADQTPRKPNVYAWNDATLGTSPTPPSKNPAATPSDSKPDVDSGTRRNRFTTIEEHESSQDRVERSEPASHFSTIASALAVILLIALCAWGLQPPSADKLFQRIQRTAATKGPADAIKDIESFVQRFPQDSRFGEIEALRMDVEGDWLAKRLGLRKRKSDGHDLEPFEQQWLDAYRLKNKEPQTARAEFESILTKYGSSTDNSSDLAKVLAAARHQILRLESDNESKQQ